MKTDSIQMILKSKFGLQEVYSQEQLQEISTLTINRFDIVGDLLKVYPEELLQFPNLKKLSINQCIVGENFISILLELKNMEEINFYNCEFTYNAEELFQLPNLKKVLLDGTEAPISFFNNCLLSTLVLSNMTINDTATFAIDELDIRKSKISNWSFLDNQIHKLVVDFYQYISNEELQHYKSYLVIMDNDNPEMIIKEVNKS